jgi:hypothetical protein
VVDKKSHKDNKTRYFWIIRRGLGKEPGENMWIIKKDVSPKILGKQ